MSDLAKKNIVNWSLSAVIAAALFSAIFFWKADYSVRGYSDSLFVSGAFELCVTVLIIIGRTGVFDIFSYSFIRIGESLRKAPEKRWDTAYDYSVYKNERRQKNKPFFIPYLAVGGACLLVALILVFVVNANGV